MRILSDMSVLSQCFRSFRCVAHRLDPMSIGIGDEGGVIMGVVLRAKAGLAVVAPASGERCAMEGVDGWPARCVEADMAAERGAGGLVADPEGQRLLPERMRLGRAVAGSVVEIIAPDVAERRQHDIIEGAAHHEIADAERDMIDHRPPPPGNSAPMPCRISPFLPSLFMRFIIC